MYIYIYTYICVYIYIYTYICVYIYLSPHIDYLSSSAYIFTKKFHSHLKLKVKS